jgi:eukaryotic-like serine/threonine-protein kinase
MPAVPPGLAFALQERYRLERELGQGGMATVYLAEDLKHNRQVAIKLLKPELSAVLGPERFEREIATLARLAHPHILPLHDSGLIDLGGQRLPYFVMPFIAGDSLRQRLQREHQLPLDTALGIARGLAAAIDSAHQSGILHRDLKPENILLAGDEPLIADFGIARAVDVAGGERLTESGLVIGTAAYMSPEQAAGSRDLDARSDGYSFACVVYEMLAGEPPFTGPTPQAVIARRFTGGVPSISQVRERIPPEVDQVFARALARTPADRFATAAAFVEALGTAAASGTAASGGRTALSTPERTSVLRALRIRALVLVAVAGLIGLGILLRGSRAPVSLDANLVAVAPFDVFEPSLQVYHEGFVDLLSRGIDGAGPLRTVAPTLAIRRWTGRSDRASAIDLGHRTGAALVVIGQVAPSGRDSIRITASVVDVASGRSLEEVRTQGATDRADALADSVAVGVLDVLARIRPIAATRSTSLGTSSLPALREYLQGEQFFRRAAWDSAFPHYERAVKLDSSFALGLSRLSTTMSWQGKSDDGLLLALKAQRLNHTLAPRESLLVLHNALGAAYEFASPDSQALLRQQRLDVMRQLVRRYPDDPEVWFLLGETLHHGNLGTAAEEYDAWTRSISLDSSFAPSYYHAVELAIQLRGMDTARSYARRFVALNTVGMQRDEESEGTRLAALLLDSTGPAISRLLDTITTPGLASALFSLQRWPDSAETALRLARRLPFINSGALAGLPEFRTVLLVNQLIVRGHVREAARLNGARARAGGQWVFLTLTLLGALPAESASATFARTLSTGGRGVVFALPFWYAQRDTLSLRALRKALQGAPAGELERWGGRRQSAYTATAAEAWLTLARGDTAGAVERFLALPDSLCSDCVFERLERAQLLAGEGRTAEAMRLLDADLRPAGYGISPTEILWFLLRGRVAERLGQREKALRSYQYVVDIWRHADPELAPEVAEARRGLERLTREESR